MTNQEKHPVTLSAVFCLIIAMLFVFSPSASAQSCSGSCPENNDCSGDAGDPPGYNVDYCMYPSGCNGYDVDEGGCCVSGESPIIFDLTGQGFHLSDSENGVWFRPYKRDPRQFMTAWPELGVQNGWLVLDRNGNGLIDDFGELFGNETPQPKPAHGKRRNGFAALAVYDALEQGGNDDGWISKEDRIYGKLRVWVDLNHDGISQPNELLTLDQVGIAAISLDYHLNKHIDNNGNAFRYKSTVKDHYGGTTAKIIYDVYVGIGQPRTTADTTSKDWPSASVPVGFITR